MAPSFDSAVSSLLCAEDNTAIFDDDENYGGRLVADEDDTATAWCHHRNHRSHGRKIRSFDGHDDENGYLSVLPLQSDECLASMAEKESLHFPSLLDYLKRFRSGDSDLRARKEAVDWISQANAHLSFGPLCSYLSINYLDRFLAAYELPKGKAWTMQLLAVACLSLAAKMEETQVPLSLDLQVGDSRFVFEARTIRRMELLVPSEIAAAVAISVAAETKTVDIEKAISVLIQHVEKERVMRCVQLMEDSILVNGSVGLVQSVPQSPIGVLDAACLSYKSDETPTTTTVGSCANSSTSSSSSNSNSDTNKRRKLNRPCDVEL
ncbi:hypothetical protein TIFTF001_009335 [Ficus carica]|uniref:B-like cyclin n=1 Tax=Ficus carica TaxID=3494 RepID=A0AA88AGR5_FICCA|nr:hypothetical protein TIFTF001_009335 [Ficus carica]